MTTEDRLESITDGGLYEKLVTAILRIAEPSYARLIHVGVNAQGRPVKSPVDGVVPKASGDKLVEVAHTTTARKSLRGKWLDPITGDVTKAIKKLNASRLSNAKENAVVVLSTNQFPPQELIDDVDQKCVEAGVELDLWECSRLAGFLDNNIDGQWLRQKYLGIKAERLSHELFLSLSKKSYKVYSTVIPNSFNLYGRQEVNLIAERPFGTNLTVLSAPSGYGKTALALMIMQSWLDQERPTIWLSETVLQQENSLSSAIHKTLEELHGASLSGNASMFTASMPLLVIVDDLAKTQDPDRALEKVISWSSLQDQQDNKDRENSFHLLVPSWPEFVVGLRQDLAKKLGPYIIDLEPLNVEEAAGIYRQQTSDTETTDEEVIQLIERLGRDPLLISLVDSENRNERPEEIVLSWIMRELHKCSYKNGVPANNYMGALRKLAKKMLRARVLAPNSNDIEDYFSNNIDLVDNLYAIIQDTELLRWHHDDDKEKLLFRHDRVRDALLVGSMSEMINTSSDDDVLSDPYYSDLLGEVIIQSKFDENCINALTKYAPLSLFAAFKKSGKARTSCNTNLTTALRKLLNEQNEMRTLPNIMFWLAARDLADTDGIEVEELCGMLATKGFWVEEALVRNGNMNAALNYVNHYDLGTTYPRRERIINHAADKHPELIGSLIKILESPTIAKEKKVCALLLSGFIGKEALELAIEKCMTQNALQGPQEVQSALWAITQCCRSNLEYCLDIAFEAFSKLSSDKEDNAGRSDQSSVLDELCGKHIASNIPQQAVPFIIYQCDKRPDIEDHLLYFLFRVDHPQALSYYVRRRAETSRQYKQAGKEIFRYSSIFNREWNLDKTYSRIMSLESRIALQNIWGNDNEQEEDRLEAFSLWRGQATVTDIPVLKETVVEGNLGDKILHARVSLGDKSAFRIFLTSLEEKDPKDTFYWWQHARGVMDAELAQGIDRYFSLVIDPKHSDALYLLSTLIMELPPENAEPILINHWDHIKDNPECFQAALFVDTYKLRKLTTQAFKEAKDHNLMLRHISQHWGFKVLGRSHLLTVRHLEILEPYLDYLDQLELRFLYWNCNDRQWFDWRRRHLDDRVNDIDDERLKYDISSLELKLDSLADEKHIWHESVQREFLSKGYSLDEAFSIITQWAKKRGTDKAVEVAGELFFDEANRSHLEMFDSLASENKDFILLRAHVHFGVKHRSLI